MRATVSHSLSLAAALVVVATLAAPASADTTLGSALEDAYTANFGGGPGVTVYQASAPSETLSAPADGTIESWRVRSGDMGAEYELRVIRPGAGETFTAAATSEPLIVPDGEDKQREQLAVNMPVRAGDRIALYVLSDKGAPINDGLATPMADELNYISDPFADGETGKPALPPPLETNHELLLQADFQAAPPVSTAGPTISGEARVGVPLTGSEGSWEDALSFTYQWLRCSSGSCTAIADATSQTYTPTVADEGRQLRLDVTATGVEGLTATASTGLTGVVRPGPTTAPLPQPPVPAAAASLSPPVVQPLVLRARLSATPSQPCSGTPVELDASASQTPHPPLTYHLRYYQFPLWYGSIEALVPGGLASFEFPKPGSALGAELASGASARHFFTFTWNRRITGLGVEEHEPANQLAFDPIIVVLTVTDASGASAGAYAVLTAAQTYSKESTGKCPTGARIRAAASSFSAPTRVAFGSSGVRARIRCLTAAVCAGSISIIPATRLLASSSAAKTKPQLLVIASNPRFRIRGHRGATVNAKLTKDGRALRRRGRPVAAIMQLTSVTHAGIAATNSVHVTLPGK